MMNRVPIRTCCGQDRDLVEQAGAPYLFVEHTVAPQAATPIWCHNSDLRSLLVVEGRIEVDVPVEGGGVASTAYGCLEGWHAAAGLVYRLRAVGGPAVVLEAGTARAATRQVAQPAWPGPVLGRVSRYKVTKPWGYEIWYTENLADPPYAFKLIHMNAGHQSSLQSHRHKVETNYVIEGEATVLNGVAAPDDLETLVDSAALPVSVHRPRSNWSSAPCILHRVIARSDYTSVEVSTPELDDVIRWQDDTGRVHGRIDAEHEATDR
jgi:quercetin dioxygenase-like cupin family protein